MRWYEDPEYWVMCEKAKELRKKKIGWGDFYLLNGLLHLWSGKKEINPEHRIKLHSQEDLQEMIIDPETALTDYGKLYRFNRWLMMWNMKEELRRRSANQFWLMFVMHELYQKKWNPDPDKKEWKKE